MDNKTNTKARQQAYYNANRDKIRAYYKEWYQRNKDSEHFKERIKLTNAVYLAKNKKYISEYKRRYYLENNDHISRYRREYQEKNKDKLAARIKELRRYRLCNPTVVSSRHCVSLDFDTAEIDAIVAHIKTTNVFNKRNPITPSSIAVQFCVSVSFD